MVPEGNDLSEEIPIRVAAMEFRALPLARREELLWEHESLCRQEKMFQDFCLRLDEFRCERRKQTQEIVDLLQEQREDWRVMTEAVLRLVDRLPPPPPHLRSA